MRWQGRRQSANVEDRRGSGGRRLALGGGIGTLAIVAIVALLGGDPTALLSGGGGGGAPTASSPEEDRLAQFVAVVLADTEDVWNAQFRAVGQTYREPKLVLFRGEVNSACGGASAAVGPFYCPGDETVYIDLSFYDDLQKRFGAPGDFAQAYVIAHEVGHHVQKLRGTSSRTHAQQQRVDEAEANRLSVRLELQADYLAGVWAHHAQRSKQILEAGDIEEALGAAGAIGDDTLQRSSRGQVVPDTFTHGTSAQRVRWFRAGFQTGDAAAGDTFATDYDEL